MRKINTEDAFKTARMIKHSNLKNVLFEYYEKGMNSNITESELEKFGMSLFFDVIACLGEVKAENEFYNLIAGICEKEVEEIKSQPITETVADLITIAKENDLKSFFHSLSALISNKSI